MSRTRSQSYPSQGCKATWIFDGHLSGDLPAEHKEVHEVGEANLGPEGTRTRTMVDERGPRKAFKPCTLRKDEWQLLPVRVRFSTSCPRYNVSGTANVDYQSYGGVGQYSASVPAHAPLSVNIDWYGAMQRLYDEAAAFESAHLQLVDSFLDIPETVNLARHITDRLRLIRVKSITKFQRLATLADLYLSYSFGIRNLGEDIGEFFASAQHLDNLVRKVKQRHGKWVRISALAPSEAHAENQQKPATPTDRQEYSHTEIDFRAGVSGSFFTEVKDDNPFLRGSLGQLGLINIPKAVWEALPLSFVSDWISDISGMLERIPSYRRAAELSEIVAVRNLSHFTVQTVTTHQELFLPGSGFWPHMGFWKYYWGNFSSDWNRALQSIGWAEVGRRKTFVYNRILGAPIEYHRDEYTWLPHGLRYSVPQALTGAALLIIARDGQGRRRGRRA